VIESDKTHNWSFVQSDMLRSAALGGCLRKKGKTYKVRLPCMDEYANVTLTEHCHTPAIQINRNSFNPITNVMENHVQPITQETHVDSEPMIRLQLSCEGEAAFTHIHVYEGLGHRLLQSDGTNVVVPPKGPFCQKVGKIRMSYKSP
jgi:hypothetical protein